MWLNNLTQLLKKFWKDESGYILPVAVGGYLYKKNRDKQNRNKKQSRENDFAREEKEADKIIADKKIYYQAKNKKMLEKLQNSGMSPEQINTIFKEIIKEQDREIKDYTYGTRASTKKYDHRKGDGNIERDKGVNRAKGHTEKVNKIYKYVGEHEDFSNRKSNQIKEWQDSKAFRDLAKYTSVKDRKKHLQQGADVGISGAQRKEEAGRVSRAVRGMTPSRKMKSMLAGQGVRGVAASALNRKVKGVADKQKANFDMKQMARSYGHKTSSADKLAGLNVDVSTFDREQGRGNLKFLTDQDIHERTLKANALNTAAKFGKHSTTDMLDTMRSVEQGMHKGQSSAKKSSGGFFSGKKSSGGFFGNKNKDDYED